MDGGLGDILLQFWHYTWKDKMKRTFSLFLWDLGEKAVVWGRTEAEWPQEKKQTS